MKKIFNIFIISLSFSFYFCEIAAQPVTISFRYDQSGNQILRKGIFVEGANLRQVQPIATETPRNNLIKSGEYENIKYYPNPVMAELFLKWKNTGNKYVTNISIYAVSGQVVTQLKNVSNKEETIIYFEKVPAGTYLLLMFYNTGESKELKILKN